MSNEKYCTVLKNLRETSRINGQRVTQAVLAEHIGISIQYLWMIENGVYKPKRKILERLAEYFGVNADCLLNKAG